MFTHFYANLNKISIGWETSTKLMIIAWKTYFDVIFINVCLLRISHRIVLTHAVYLYQET